MTEREALLAAILDDPECDTARLIYADWLEEHSEGARAEFIRVQVELATMPTEVQALKLDEQLNEIWAGSVVIWKGKPATDEQMAVLYRCRQLRRRERELLLTRGLEWVPRIDEKNTFELILSPRWEFTGKPACEFSRGFVSALACTCADFMAHAAAIWREQPVERVVLTDKRPIEVESGAMFCRDFVPQRDTDPWGLVPEIFNLLRGYSGRTEARHSIRESVFYPSTTDAQSALSAACVAHGRALARAGRGTVEGGTMTKETR